MQLEGTRIIVTGGAQGIGAATVVAYVCEGARVVALDVRDDLGTQVVDTANQRGPGTGWYHHCDITDPNEIEVVFNTTTSALGGLDVLVNAAGVLGRLPADRISVEEWDRVFDVNVRGTLLTNQAAFRAMRETGGRIINFGSGAGLNPFPGGAHYSASKGAVMAWTRSVAHEWGSYGITVNAVVPGMWTPMYEQRRSEMSQTDLEVHDARNRERIPLGGKLGDPDRDLGPVMVFLASEGARFMTGQLISVTGGAVLVR